MPENEDRDPPAPSGGLQLDPLRPVPLSEPPAKKPAATTPPAAELPPRLPRRTPVDRAPARAFINLCGDYRFLRAGYWALVDAELNDVASRPTPLQAATAQNAAACLLVAQRNGIRCVDWKLARSPKDVDPPCLLVPVAGLTDTCYQVNSARSAETQWRSATQNGTRAALAVKLDGPMRSMRMIAGVTSHPDYQMAWNVWQSLGIPLATIWFVEAKEGDRFLGLDPLPLHELTERELRLFEEVSKRPMSRS